MLRLWIYGTVKYIDERKNHFCFTNKNPDLLKKAWISKHSLTWKEKVFESLKFAFKRSARYRVRYRRIDLLLFYPKFVITTLLTVRCVSTIPQKSDQVKPTGMELDFLTLLCSDLKSENPDPDQCFYNVQCFGSGFNESGSGSESNPDPGFWWQKIYSWKKNLIFFFITNCNLLPVVPRHPQKMSKL
jgi:hypothetical protein